ncbi:hypothetical protein XENOCAPTIV_011502, partial [Xenoophorus captivus]
DRIINMVMGGFTSVVVLLHFSVLYRKKQIFPVNVHIPRLTIGILFSFRLNDNLLVSQVTVIGSFVFPSMPPRPVNIFFAACILLACGSTVVLVTKTLMVLACNR